MQAKAVTGGWKSGWEQNATVTKQVGEPLRSDRSSWDRWNEIQPKGGGTPPPLQAYICHGFAPSRMIKRIVCLHSGASDAPQKAFRPKQPPASMTVDSSAPSVDLKCQGSCASESQPLLHTSGACTALKCGPCAYCAPFSSIVSWRCFSAASFRFTGSKCLQERNGCAWGRR